VQVIFRAEPGSRHASDQHCPAVPASTRRRDNRWTQVPLDELWGVAYDRLLYTAHAIVVAELRA
jgi:hypothetical protein